MKTSNIKRKLIAIAMASVMAGSTMTGMTISAVTLGGGSDVVQSVGATVSEGVTSDGWKYGITDDGTATIRKYVGNAKKVTLPKSIEGKNIRGFLEECLKDTTVETLIIPDGTPIPIKAHDTGYTKRAFQNSTNLKEVSIGSMFAECIPSYAFAKCSKLEKVTFTRDFSKKAIEAGSCAINPEAFNGSAIKSFVVPEGITNIELKALASKSLVNVSFPTTIVSNIEDYSNMVSIGTITGLSASESGIKNIIVKGETTVLVGFPTKANIYCSKNSSVKILCDEDGISTKDISTINVEKVECGWLGIPYEPATTPTTTTVPTTTTETKPTETTTTTETKPTETDVTETTTMLWSSFFVTLLAKKYHYSIMQLPLLHAG